ncbi:hypothetical protein A2Z00_04310 [Candidatus Gottesmanbacteria bacterium RBG_13_45_10]|uniref:Response regulatory domain-containing protein n=1 Tax=Candidatus Gottesmanbacteria bacterium RBG_13_45_10 TaxID=1798370 RepID=A0A1F5ZHC0_9BACT|nr:MAG: hypothetical protein A2Z00_04310 [Candidatus Gottesmanbacteria bacterium RBG_13_45_10]
MANILIIEDDPYVRRFYERLFRFNKCDVDLAANGAEGIEKAKTLKPHLILLDIMMPEVDGIQVLEKLKKDDTTKDCLVVMLTNLGDDETIKKATELGADGFIVKSNVTDEELIKKVEAYMEMQSSTAPAASS